MNPVERYIESCQPDTKPRLNAIRALFLGLVPDVEESIRYNMPAYKVGKGHLYFAAYKKHIGFYPVYGLHDIFPELSAYKAKGTKDSLHFKHSQPLPEELIRKIILYKSQY
jgi:uncharacterized protein YdhG (YjbR/CyaY superfamily)